ncbi:MAG: ammonium transporter [Rhizobiaceae bacterium]|nr:ammonium transporter [Rhizobiaceae bacterium]MCV0407642.1 ammonium transporter [Rhizobiaceae bacterium]
MMELSKIASAARPILLGGLALTAFGALAAFAQEAAEPAAEAAAEAAPEFASAAETAFIFNTLLFLIGGFLVMWMAAGFAMLEAGLVRSKNVSMQLLKNIALYSIAGIMYWVVGYSLMYTNVDGGYFGTLMPYSWPAAGTANEGDYAVASDWFFQMVFVATAASIVSGTLAERIKLWPFLIFVVVLTGFIYPIAGSWKWGAGWLDAMGFQDFAGSTLVHSVGGWAALAGAVLLGARKGKFGAAGEVHPMPGSNMALATLGTFILWLGWFGFNGASQLAMGSNADVSDISRIFANTNLAACGGVVAALILTQVLYRKVDITMVLNGALAGLVSITAEPLTPSPFAAIIIGAIGGVIVVFAVPLLDKLKIDDVVGAIPVHLLAGIWGTLAVPLTNGDASFGVQIVGIVAYGVFAFAVSLIVWFVIKAAMGLRASDEAEQLGMDKAEIGVEAYPEFSAAGTRFS